MANLSRNEKFLIVVWASILISFYVIATTIAAIKVTKDKVESRERHLNRINANAQEAGRTWVDPQKLKADEQEQVPKVSVGMYVDHIADFSTLRTNWTVDFYIWFRWHDKNLKPGETFQVMDGEMLSCSLIDSTIYKNERYELYRVHAQITKFFNVMRFPRDNHMLTISIENKVYNWHQMQFVPDVVDSDISSRVKLPGYTISDAVMVTKPHPYKTNRGNPRFKENTEVVYDQVIYGMNISRSDWGLYFKLFESLFASVAIALLVFLMDPKGDGRVGLGIGAFFASVASSYVTSNELPGMGILTLSDLINILGMATIFLSVLCSIIVMKIARNDKKLSLARFFDRLSLTIFLLGYLIANIVIAKMAS
jgi:hypothetical protein